MMAFRRAAVVLALAAMMLRGLMPAGWMPNSAGAGESLFVICDMDQDMPGMGMPGMNMASMDMSHMDMSAMSKTDMAKRGVPGMDMSGMDHGSSGKHSQHSMDGHQQACPFGAAPHVATSSNVVAFLLPSQIAGFTARHSHERVAADIARYTPQSPRAPPASLV
ncbi:MAG TPA: hypothetical protein VGI89_00910 [Rhizomicrobium sp.]|jgi:uncharacterized protein involved in copper resistance